VGVVEKLSGKELLALDLETTGLLPHHGDKLFSLAIASNDEEFYFNFQNREDIPESFVLPIDSLLVISQLFELSGITWFIHNAKFDMSFLFNEGFTIAGKIYCTKVGERIVRNYEQDLSLATCGDRIGVKKDDTVDTWIKTNGAYTKQIVNETHIKKKDYTKVPFDLIVKYACQDARVCYDLGIYQTKVIDEWVSKEPRIPLVREVLENEASLTKTLFWMETRGVTINRQYCKESLVECLKQMKECIDKFKESCGSEFKLSNKVFQEVFVSDKPNWEYTDKNNPSFVSGVLKNFSNEAASYVVKYRELKSRYDFFNKFLFYADSEDYVHTSFNSAEGRTGRLSSSNPNLQNLRRPDEKNIDPLDVRSAFIPRPGYVFVMFDYSQLEYRVMLDQAGANGLIDKVKSGLDVHEATARLAGITRQQAKTCNFLTLYGGGVKLLAENLGTTEDKARGIRQAIFRAAPEIKEFINAVVKKAETRGWIFNWFGRRYYFPDTSKCYKAPNYLIQGGCADLLKIVMNKCHELLQGTKSFMLLTIHDELVFELHKTELHLAPKIKEIMETTYPHKKLPMAVSVEYSYDNLSKSESGFPPGTPVVQSERGAEKSRDKIQGSDQTSFSFSSIHMVREDTASNASRNP
jgi:DNA polymerase-1